MIKQSLRGDIFAVAVCSSASFFFFPYFHLSTLPFPCLLFRAPPPSPSSPPPSFPTTNSFLLFFSPPSPHFHREEEERKGGRGEAGFVRSERVAPSWSPPSALCSSSFRCVGAKSICQDEWIGACDRRRRRRRRRAGGAEK